MVHKNSMRRFLFGFLAVLMHFIGFSQNSNEPKSLGDTYLIQNVRLISQPGIINEGYSILLKDGIIQKVGLNVEAPFDAQIVKADSMYVYPGFIAAASHIGLKKEEKKKRPNVDDPGNPPNAVAGILPQRSMSSLLSLNDNSIKAARSNGFTLAQSFPDGNMLPGQACLITLQESKQLDEVLIEDKSALYAQLKPASGRIYPSTTIAVIAKWEEMYKNAELAKAYQERYALNPSGLSKPNVTKEIQALIPVVAKEQPVFFKAEKTLDLYRVLSLQEDQKFDLVLTNTKQANQILNKLSGLVQPLVISMDLPKEIKEEAKDSTKVIDEEIGKFSERKMQSYQEYVSQARDLEKANVDFAFSLLDVKSKEVLPNLRRMVKAGLSETTALRALTTVPASLLGISNIAGSIEEGKMANLVICDQSIFEEKSSIRHVFVNGKHYKMNPPKKKLKKNKGADTTVDFTGVWRYEVEIPGDVQRGKITIVKEESEFSVQIVGDDDPNDVEEVSEVSIDGNNMSFPLEVEAGEGVLLTVNFDVEFDEDSFEGTVTISGMGAFPINASRVDPK
jgi:hypothetical protein